MGVGTGPTGASQPAFDTALPPGSLGPGQMGCGEGAVTYQEDLYSLVFSRLDSLNLFSLFS